MKKFTQILILSIFTILMIGSFANSAFAADPLPLSVTFSSDPLFKAVNFAPGGKVTGNIEVTNNSGSSQHIIVEATNAVDSSGLGDKLNLIIKEGNATPYTGTLGEFLRDGEVSLSSLADTANTNYSFDVTFDGSAGDDLQGKNLGFDLCIGFEGGNMQCGGTVISDGNGGSTSFLGSSGSPVTLTIYNEQALNITNVDNSSSTIISWNTNKLATSQVIYGLASGIPYTLNLNTLPDLGYPLGTVEDGNKVMDHSVLLTGLTPGETYVYRVVSHASPATVSYEHQFTVPLLAQGDNNNNTILNNNPNNNILNANGQVLGAENGQSAIGEPTTDQNVEDLNNNEGNLLGASAGSIMGIPSVWFWFAVILLLILIIFLIIYRRRKNKKAQ